MQFPNSSKKWERQHFELCEKRVERQGANRDLRNEGDRKDSPLNFETRLGAPQTRIRAGHCGPLENLPVRFRAWREIKIPSGASES